MQTTSFIGCAVELRQLQEHLAAIRLLTLVGAGGAGKSRLGLGVADEAVDAHLDGVWLFELASLADSALLSHAVGSHCRLQPVIAPRSAANAAGVPFGVAAR